VLREIPCDLGYAHHGSPGPLSDLKGITQMVPVGMGHCYDIWFHLLRPDIGHGIILQERIYQNTVLPNYLETGVSVIN